MKRLCSLVYLLAFFIHAYAGGGSSLAKHCVSFTKSVDTPPCGDEVVRDMFECGYKNKWDSRGLSEAADNRAEYCMFQKGYRIRGWQEGRATCEGRPNAPGCAEVITPPKGEVN